MIQYGILDDSGRVVRWVWERPPAIYDYVLRKVRRPQRKRIDLSKFERALI